MSAAKYTASLVLASTVAAFSLVHDSIEGVVASMLISPIGGPIMALANAMASYNARNSAIQLVVLGASAAAMLTIGMCVRMFDLYTGSVSLQTRSVLRPNNSRICRAAITTEMRKRIAKFGVVSVLMYATTIGIAMAIVLASGGDSVTSTGLAIAISILPPTVNAGILAYDSVVVNKHNIISDTCYPRLERAATTSASLAAVNVVGVVLGAIAVKKLMARS